jgi:DNA-binding Lrp family transcriptional regulator
MRTDRVIIGRLPPRTRLSNSESITLSGTQLSESSYTMSSKGQLKRSESRIECFVCQIPSNFVTSRELFHLSGLPKLDRIDVNILVQLQKDGRMTNANLSDAVGLSASPCLQRVKRLEAGGYITGYGAHVNLGKLTESITVFTEVTLIDHRKEDFVRFESNLRNVEELMECHLVSGGYDYLLRFVSRSINHYQERMENLLERNIGIEKYFSYIVLKSPIVKSVLPLKALIDPSQ